MKAELTLLLLVLVGCSSGRHYAPVDTSHGELRAADGRTVILRGINARVAGLFDVTFDDGRLPLETIPDLPEADVARMASLGFNLLRLPLSWSGIEPQPGLWSPTFFATLTSVIDSCRAHGIYVLLDLHQDAWSKEIGEDGAPLWAIQPPPDQLLGGPLDDLGSRRSSAQVLSAFSSFFATDTDMLQEKFAEMVQQLAIHFRGDPTVLGFEIFNEPLATDDQLLAFHTKVARAIRDYDAEHLIAFEPSATRNFTDSASIANAPFPVGGAVYAPHIYTAVFNNDARLTNDTYEAALAASISSARDEATGWDTPLLVGEFGVGPQQPHALEWISHAYDATDSVFASTAFWLWKEQDQGQWGLFSHAADGTWQERTDMIAAVSRPYAKAIGGTPTMMSWDGATFTLRSTARAEVPRRHDVFFPNATPAIACNGNPIPIANVDADALGTTYSVTCDGELTLRSQ